MSTTSLQKKILIFGILFMMSAAAFSINGVMSSDSLDSPEVPEPTQTLPPPPETPPVSIPEARAETTERAATSSARRNRLGLDTPGRRPVTEVVSVGDEINGWSVTAATGTVAQNSDQPFLGYITYQKDAQITGTLSYSPDATFGFPEAFYFSPDSSSLPGISLIPAAEEVWLQIENLDETESDSQEIIDMIKRVSSSSTRREFTRILNENTQAEMVEDFQGFDFPGQFTVDITKYNHSVCECVSPPQLYINSIDKIQS